MESREPRSAGQSIVDPDDAGETSRAMAFLFPVQLGGDVGRYGTR